MHRDDELVSRKFRVARCGEIALGQQAAIWVPWVTPADAAKVAGWMQVGFDLWAALRAARHEPIEVYPAGVFRVLAGVVPPRKTTREGLHARIELLAPLVDLPAGIEMWSHDGIDALGAALTAHQRDTGIARRDPARRARVRRVIGLAPRGRGNRLGADLTRGVRHRRERTR